MVDHESLDILLPALQKRVSSSPRPDKSAYPSQARRRLYSIMVFDCKGILPFTGELQYYAFFESVGDPVMYRSRAPSVELYRKGGIHYLPDDAAFWKEEILGPKLHTINANHERYLQVYTDIIQKIPGIVAPDIEELKSDFSSWYSCLQRGEKVITFW